MTYEPIGTYKGCAAGRIEGGMNVRTYCTDCRESTHHRELLEQKTGRHNFYQCVRCDHVVKAPNMDPDAATKAAGIAKVQADNELSRAFECDAQHGACRMTERYKLTQWLVVADGKDLAMFTPLTCDEETAMAIAVSTFGSGVTKLVDEGAIRQELNAAQLNIANSANCASCGMYKVHDVNCPTERAS